MIFNPNYLILSNGTAVALKYIESMRFPDNEEDLTYSKLKDDFFIEIGMCSGKEYVISTRDQFNINDWRIKEENGVGAGRQAIFDKWNNLMKD